MNQAGIAARDEIAALSPYRSDAAFYDEMLTSEGQIRAHWQPLMDSIAATGQQGLASRWQEGRRLLHDNGVTFNVYGDLDSTNRPWPLDPLPFLIGEAEWASIEAAMCQRATLLN